MIKLEENKKLRADLIREMEGLKGFKMIRGTELLDLTNQIFSANFIQLCSIINAYENDPELVFLSNHQKLDEITFEIIRSFHNYSASSFTLIRHSSVFKESLENGTLNTFYDNEVKILNEIEVVCFMKDLRNYVQHRSFPITRRRFSAKIIENTNNYEMEQKILLSLQSLLEWDKWTSKAKAYLKRFNGDIEIKQCCTEYYEHITEFNKAFFEMLFKEYEKDINELEKFKNNINKLYPLYPL